MTNDEAVELLTSNHKGQPLYNYATTHYPILLTKLFVHGVRRVVLSKEAFVGIVAHSSLVMFTVDRLGEDVSNGNVYLEVFGVHLSAVEE